MILLGLGTSERAGLSYLRQAVQALKAMPGLSIHRVSPIYRSDAMLPAGAPSNWEVEYLNLAIACTVSGGDPLSWLRKFKELEKHLGRKDRERWAPREIDIDILAWHDQVIESTELKVPHPGLLDRPFALLPLADVAPDWVHPQPPKSEAEAASTSARVRSSPWRNGAPVPYNTTATRKPLTQLVGILNLTPDSFSDGGKLQNEKAIHDQATSLIQNGATVLDIGAESTRPGASEISPEEELTRLELAQSVLESLRQENPSIRFSLDTRKAQVAREALKLFSWDWINDVEGFSSSEMIHAVQDRTVKLVMMHSLGVPPSKDRTLPGGCDPIGEILAWGERQLLILSRHGVDRDRIILDPGVGFGKTPDQNWMILRQAYRLHSLGVPVLIGHSRKSFLAEHGRRADQDRDLETALLTAQLAAQGTEYVRIHQASMNQKALRFQMRWNGVSRWIP